MKKLFYATFTGLLAAATFVLAGCEQPSFTADPVAPIAKPALRAEALPGAVFLSWDPVADAGSYKIYRKDGDGVSTALSVASGAVYHVDKVDFGNTLKNEDSYTYTLEAVVRSGAATPLVSALSDPQTVTADVPARTPTIVKAPAAEALTVAPYVSTTGTPADQLEVYWETTKAELPLSYTVEYLYGDGSALPLVYSTATNSSSGLTQDFYTKRAAFPLVGGDSTVKITASWGSNSYYAPAAVTKAYTGAPTVLPAVGTLSVSGSGTLPDGGLTLEWNALTGATGYDVYRAEITSGGPTSSASTTTSSLTGAVIGAYETVSPAPGSPRENGGIVYLTDAGYDSSKKWLYLVIAKNDEGARSSAPALYVRIASTPSVSTPSSFNVNTFQDTAVGSSEWKVSVSWTKAEGETYKLYRAPIERSYNGSSYTVTGIGAYVEIPAASLSDQDGKVIYIDTVGTAATNLSHGQSYRYKVVASKDGASNEDTGDLTTTPFTRFISGSPAVQAGDSYGQFKIIPYEPQYYANLSYEIYAAESDGTRLTSGWTLVTLSATADSSGYYTATWSTLNTLKRYVFSQVTKSGTTTLVNQAAVSINPPYAPNLAASSSSWSQSLTLAGQDATRVVIQVGSPLSPSGSGNWWLEESAYKTLFGAKIYREEEASSYSYTTETARTSVATVQFNATNAAINAGVTGASVPAWSFYIVLPKYQTITAANGSETWVFGTEYNSGNPSYSSTGITYDNYYTISKTTVGTTVTVTVSSVY
jgi:hypothetical protein